MLLFRNQEQFPYLIADALQGICGGKFLGSCIMSLSYGYRDENGGVVSGS